jgi:predicted hydrocarbon binding protein
MSASPALHERLRFQTERGQVLDDDRRYLLMRADVLMGLFAELAPAERARALEALGRSVRRHGADSLRAYAEAEGMDRLTRVVADAAASLGWGVWHLVRDGSEVRLSVDNSPFAAAAAQPTHAPTCHAIAGMLEGLASAYGAGARAREVSCAAVHGGSTCHFVASTHPRSSLT